MGLYRETSEAFRQARGVGIYISASWLVTYPFFVLVWLGLDFLFHFSSFILHLLFCLLCFNQWDALTTRLSFVLPSELPLVPLVSSNTHFFPFLCGWDISNAYRKTAAFKQQMNHLFATSWGTHRKSNQHTNMSHTYHLSKTFFSVRQQKAFPFPT